MEAACNKRVSTGHLLEGPVGSGKSIVVCSVRAWSSSNITLSIYFNHLTFSCFNYGTQITKISLTHTARKSLENQLSNTNSIMTKSYTMSERLSIISQFHVSITSQEYHSFIPQENHSKINSRKRTQSGRKLELLRSNTMLERISIQPLRYTGTGKCLRRLKKIHSKGVTGISFSPRESDSVCFILMFECVM